MENIFVATLIKLSTGITNFVKAFMDENKIDLGQRELKHIALENANVTACSKANDYKKDFVLTGQ